MPATLSDGIPHVTVEVGAPQITASNIGKHHRNVLRFKAFFLCFLQATPESLYSNRINRHDSFTGRRLGLLQLQATQLLQSLTDNQNAFIQIHGIPVEGEQLTFTKACHGCQDDEISKTMRSPSR
jgi:hypothetical protein